MGFHVVKNGDYQFITAGHCGYAGSNAWYHSGYGNIGSETASVYHHLGDDLMWVNMPNSGQASDDIYHGSTNIVGMATPITGETVCASMGFSHSVDCGVVTDNFLTYAINEAYGGYTLYGGDIDGIARTGGDSGSPIYRDLAGDVAIGLHSTASGKFARIADVLPGAGWLVVT